MREVMLNRRLAAAFGLLSLCGLSFVAFAVLVVQDFSAPFAGREDANQWEYLAYYFSNNVEFDPFPNLHLVNNQVFYPYGTTNVFQSWGFEREYFYGVLYSLFGIGPWLKAYYLLSIAITFCGSFALLHREYGSRVSTMAALVITFFSFYAMHEYPEHLNIAVIHWTVLNLIADFVIARRVVASKAVSLRFLMLRGLLLVLALGLDLGYVAGFALMSFVITAAFVGTLVLWRLLRERATLRTTSLALMHGLREDLRLHPRAALVLTALVVTAVYLYVPLVLEVAAAARQFDFTGHAGYRYWVSPYRLLVPVFPQINPIDQGWRLGALFEDRPDGFSSGSPGWFLVAFAGVGVFRARRRLLAFVPVIAMLLLCLCYRPNFPTLNLLFPWFEFYRVGGRATIIYPTLLVLLGLGGMEGSEDGRKQVHPMLIGMLLIFALAELWTAYSFKNPRQPPVWTRSFKSPRPPHRFTPDFFEYMNRVKAQPGEAVLDWPFCVASGNGVGDELCPLYDQNNGIHALRRFHTKKVMGQYFGRLHPSQIQPYLDAGWLTLLAPDEKDGKRVRCFEPHEWEFFTRFFAFNDFAGINLYVDLLPPECPGEFYARYGPPVAETRVPVAGRVQFIPKDPSLRSRTNPRLGLELKLEKE